MALFSRPRGDLFQILLPTDFIPDPIRVLWQPYIERMPTVINNVDDFINESIQSIEPPPLDYEPVEQQTWDKGSNASYTQKHKSSIHSQDLPDKTLSITFRMTDGYANYWILKQSLMWRFQHEQRPPYLEWLKILALDIDGYIMTQEKYMDLNFRGISGYRLSYSNVQQDFQTFECTFSFSQSNFQYPGEL